MRICYIVIPFARTPATRLTSHHERLNDATKNRNPHEWYESTYKPMTLDSFKSAMMAAAPSNCPPQVDFYDPIVAQTYPDPSAYDLIILSGGTADPMGSEPWVLKVQSFIRQTVSSFPRKKILGICWGHQTICVAFGGIVIDMDGPEIGVTNVNLNTKGKEMFPFVEQGNMRIHEFHKRIVRTPAKGFVTLAGDHQIFLNEENTVLSFQGHPELDAEVAKVMLDVAPAYLEVDAGKKEELLEKIAARHDGDDIWRRIMAWVNE